MDEHEVARWLCFVEALDIIYDHMDEHEIEELNLETASKQDRAYRGICKYIKERQAAMLEDLRLHNVREYGLLL